MLRLLHCAYGKMDINSSLGRVYKQKYYEGDKMSCARYIVSTQLGPDYVTDQLYPNMNDQAKKLLAEHKK